MLLTWLTWNYHAWDLGGRLSAYLMTCASAYVLWYYQYSRYLYRTTKQESERWREKQMLCMLASEIHSVVFDIVLCEYARHRFSGSLGSYHCSHNRMNAWTVDEHHNNKIKQGSLCAYVCPRTTFNTHARTHRTYFNANLLIRVRMYSYFLHQLNRLNGASNVTARQTKHASTCRAHLHILYVKW